MSTSRSSPPRSARRPQRAPSVIGHGISAITPVTGRPPRWLPLSLVTRVHRTAIAGQGWREWNGHQRQVDALRIPSRLNGELRVRNLDNSLLRRPRRREWADTQKNTLLVERKGDRCLTPVLGRGVYGHAEQLLRGAHRGRGGGRKCPSAPRLPRNPLGGSACRNLWRQRGSSHRLPCQIRPSE